MFQTVVVSAFNIHRQYVKNLLRLHCRSYAGRKSLYGIRTQAKIYLFLQHGDTSRGGFRRSINQHNQNLHWSKQIFYLASTTSVHIDKCSIQLKIKQIYILSNWHSYRCCDTFRGRESSSGHIARTDRLTFNNDNTSLTYRLPIILTNVIVKRHTIIQLREGMICHNILKIRIVSPVNILQKLL